MTTHIAKISRRNRVLRFIAQRCFQTRASPSVRGALKHSIWGGPVKKASWFSASTSNTGDIRDVLSLPKQYLRDMDKNNFDYLTKQRKDVLFDAANGKPKMADREEGKYNIKQCVKEGTEYLVEWGDGVTSRYSEEWVERALANWNQTYEPTVDRILWTCLTESDVRSTSMSLSFPDILTDEGMAKALRTLYQYGLLLVTETPVDDGGSGVAALASAVSGGSVKTVESTSLLASFRSGNSDIMLPHGTDGPLRTLYGTVWSTTSSGQAEGASIADSAYGRGALPLHTDMTYHRDPPGLQIFTMVNPAITGGQSVFADGFAVADHLRSIEPDAFSTLCNVDRTYRCVDRETGWDLEAHGPVISVRRGKIVGIRHNDLDRLPDLPPKYMTSEEADHYYECIWYAHDKLDQILARDEFRLQMSLETGDTVIVANQRCFHARNSFETTHESPRSVMGCYVSQDDLDSRFRLEGFCVD